MASRCHVLGCISAAAILLYPREAAEAARILPNAICVCDATDVAQHVLGLDDEQANRLFIGHPDDPEKLPEAVTPQQAALAVERILAGTDPMDIWDHVVPMQPANEDETEQDVASQDAA